MSEEKKEENKDQSAKEIAEIMVANMKDPDFWSKRERIRQEARDEVLKKLRERNQNNK